MRKEELLKEIVMCSGKEYISDLSRGIKEQAVKDALRRILDSGLEYGLSEWKDTISYLTGETILLKDMDAVHHYIKNL